jgi:hypothetical protein
MDPWQGGLALGYEGASPDAAELRAGTVDWRSEDNDVGSIGG